MRTMKNLLLGLMLAALATAGYAQDGADVPPLIFRDGGLYAWDEVRGVRLIVAEAVRPQSFALSPDGEVLAYTAFADATFEAFERTGGGAGSPPVDVWVLYLDDGVAQRVAAQPEGAVWFSDSGPDLGIARSRLVWTPDGSKVVWGELRYPDNTYWAGAYDLNTATTSEVRLEVLDDAAGIPAPPSVAVTNTRFAVLGNTMVDGETFTQVHVFDHSGENRMSWQFSERFQFVRSYWLTEASTQAESRYLFVGDYFGGGVVDTATVGEAAVSAYAGALVAFKPGVDASVRVRTTEPNWTLTFPDGSTVSAAVPFQEVAPVITPDGQGVVLSAEGVSVQVGNSLSPLDGIGGPGEPSPLRIDWGPVAWQLAPSSELETVITVMDPPYVTPIPPGAMDTSTLLPAPTTAAADCPGLPEPLLTVGFEGVVVEGLGANNLRSAPSGDATLIGELAPSTRFVIRGGPTCSDGFRWWEVETYTGVRGWTADGSGEVRWLADGGPPPP
jgi:hypothetical protein